MASHTSMSDPVVSVTAPAGLPVVTLPSAPVPRTAAGARAVQRRRARVAGVRRPASGVLPSSGRTSAVVTADRGDQVDDREFGMGRWARLTTTLMLVATAVLVAVSVFSATSTEASPTITDVQVVQGDSLWSIAQRAEPEADPRSVVDQIKQLNALTGDGVMAGVVLRVPTVGR